MKLLDVDGEERGREEEEAEVEEEEERAVLAAVPTLPPSLGGLMGPQYPQAKNTPLTSII